MTDKMVKFKEGHLPLFITALITTVELFITHFYDNNLTDEEFIGDVKVLADYLNQLLPMFQVYFSEVVPSNPEWEKLKSVLDKQLEGINLDL